MEIKSIRYRWWALVYWSYAIWLGISNAHKTHLGSTVWHKNRKWFVNNGVLDGKWSLIAIDTREKADIPRSECRRVRSLNEWRHSARFMYRWWMTSWHRIYVERKYYKWESK